MNKKFAHIYHEIDNQNDSEARWCSNCHFYLGSYPMERPKQCPNCKLELKEIGDVRIV